MKIVFSALLLAVGVNFVFANEIDKLHTNIEVNNFINKRILKEELDENMLDEDLIKSLPYGKNKFHKLDIDKNGLTDLIVDGKELFVVTDKGNSEYGIYPIDGPSEFYKFTLTAIVYRDKIPALVVRRYDNFENKIGGKETERTLIHKFEDFVEYNSKPDNFKIEEIKFSTSGCYGTCPIFEITIKNSKTAFYDAKNFNEVKGEFNGTIDAASYDKLIKTINYVGLLKLNDEFDAPWTDDQTVTLEVKYDGGKIKRISDYGTVGSFGLSSLYNQLYTLRRTQTWIERSKK